jgi:lysyl-tRNA synthetase class 2
MLLNTQPALLHPAPAPDGHTPSTHRRAASIVAEYATDSLDPFALREDKRFHFARGGLLAYRTLRETAVVAGDPIGPGDSARPIVESFLRHAGEQRWNVGITAASGRHLDAYRGLGLRAMHIGNEAVVDPQAFSLEGRAVRKVRQSVSRVQRRGWSVEVVPAGELTAHRVRELEALESQWETTNERLSGFSMTLGRLRGGAADETALYVLGRGPEGELHAFLRFAGYRHGLSLDVMRRLGDEPNGLNEALVVAALGYAREQELRQVSLNFAGFGHLMAPTKSLTPRQRAARWALNRAHGSFQLERLVRFNDKFFPSWHPRYLLYPRRTLLPLIALRVLQAEGYARAPDGDAVSAGWRPLQRPLGAPAATRVA